MTGILGLLDSTAQVDVHVFMADAAASLSHFPWFVSENWIAPDAPVGLGRIGIGIFNREKQPITSADGNLILFMVGEFYDTDELRKNLITRGCVPRNDTHPELALAAFQTYGADFAKVLKGVFMIAVYEVSRRHLTITNDRFGLYTHYYAHQKGRLVFASEVKAILRAPFVERKLNTTAAAEYFRFQQVLGVKTFHEGIKRFPNASIGEFDMASGEFHLRRYWDWDEIPDRSQLSFDDAVAETGLALRRALERLTPCDSLRTGVFLSGGLDSRTVLGMLPPRASRPVTATYGLKGCRDQYYAQRIADTVGSQHYWFDMPNGDWVRENADLHLTLTEGFHSWVNMHGITMLPKLREVMDYNLTGWAGEFQLGTQLIAIPGFNEPIDQFSVIQELFYRLTQRHSWPGLNEGEARMIYTPEFGKHALGAAFESLTEEFKPYQRFRPGNQVDYFFVTNHCGRLTGNMVNVARSHIEMRFPYWDYDFMDHVYSLNPHYRWGKPRGKLYMNLITRETPKLVSIPYDKDEFLPTANEMRRSLQAWSVRIRRRMGLFPNRPTLYADYESYLRHELHDWAEGILFDPRTEERGILNMPFVRSLFMRHISGNEEWTIGKIAPLMTFEMMMRKYFD